MATAPFDHRFRESRHGAQPGSDRGIHQHENHGPHPFVPHSYSVPLAQKSACRKSTLPIKPYEAYSTRQRALEASYERSLLPLRSPFPLNQVSSMFPIPSYAPELPSYAPELPNYAPELDDGRVQRCSEEFDGFLEDWIVEPSPKQLFEYFISLTLWVINDKIWTVESSLKKLYEYFTSWTPWVI